MSNRVVYPLKRSQRKAAPDAGYLDPSYYAITGQHHTGEDWNGPGGGDSDVGYPIYAVADGFVVAVIKNAAPKWGNIVVIHSPQFGLWFRYAHLETMGLDVGALAVGTQIMAGQKIGTMGGGYRDSRGRWAFAVHLHIDAFQVEPKSTPGGYLNWPGGSAAARNEVKRIYYPLHLFWPKWKAGNP